MISALKGALGKLGEAAMGIVGLLIAFFIVAAPYLVARVFPVQAYRSTEAIGMIALVVAALACMCALVRAWRPIAGVTISFAAFPVLLFLWVWSVIIVNYDWGIVGLYVANFFFGVGTIFAAFLATLFAGQWSILGQLLVIGIIYLALTIGGHALGGSGDQASTPSSLSVDQ